MANDNALSSSLDIICGSMAGATGKLFEYPFDTIKVRLQSSSIYSGPWECFKLGIQEEGLRGLYRGISSPLVGAAAENASLFFTYNIAVDTLAKYYPASKAWSDLSVSLIGGAVSGAVTSFVLTPIELVKCQIQVFPNRTVSGILKTVLRSPEGVLGLWKGQLGTLFRETGGSSSWFGAYGYVTSLFKARQNKTDVTTVESMMAGACAGVAYNISLFPADTIKSRMQTVGGSKSFIEVGREIIAKQGVKGLYRGCGITIGRAAPSSAIIFVSYEEFKALFENQVSRRPESI